MNKAHETYHSFIDKFFVSYDNIHNQDNKVISKSYNPMSLRLICCIHRKNYLHSKYCKRSTSANEFNYKIYKNKLTVNLTNAEKTYCHNTFDAANNKIKQT